MSSHPRADRCSAPLVRQVKGKDVAKIEAIVSEPAVKLAGKSNPQTPLEGKFSLAYCAALGLKGYEATEEDFCDERIADPELRNLLSRVEPKPTETMAQTAARIVVELRTDRGSCGYSAGVG